MKSDSLREKLTQLLAANGADITAAQQRHSAEILAGNSGKLIFCGVGGYIYPHVSRSLQRLRIEPLALCDNNAALWGTTVEGCKVWPPEEAVNRFGQEAVFVVTIPNGAKVRDQLQRLGARSVVHYRDLLFTHPRELLPLLSIDRPLEIWQQAEDVERAFELWDDEASKAEYVGLLEWFAAIDPAARLSHVAPEYTYFDPEVLGALEREVVIDCGAADGDTIKQLCDLGDAAVAEVVGIEPDPQNFGRLAEFVRGLPASVQNKIQLVRAASGSRRGEVSFVATAAYDARVAAEGEGVVDSVLVDEVSTRSAVTLIKMDVEGAERDALLGAKRVISTSAPTLAVCLYHRQSDLWQIPLLVSSMTDRYSYYLRRYAEDCWETVMYAVAR